MKNLKELHPETVTVRIPEHKAKQLSDTVEILLPEKPGLIYDFSTIRLICGLKPGILENEFIIDKDDLSMGIQLTIGTVPEADHDKQKNELLRIITT